VIAHDNILLQMHENVFILLRENALKWLIIYVFLL
jgi:hypothetical protein